MDRAGLWDAAVATGSFAMPSKEPAPSFGTVEQAGPKGWSIGMVSSAGALEELAFAEPASEPDVEVSLSPEQAVSANGSTAAADTARAMRRK
ncbi:hypothetical protein GCM10020227_15560 [Streptomyces flavovirens]